VLADREQNARRRAPGAVPAVISPIALDMVQRIDALFGIERGINGQDAEQR
jgi:transposase